MRLGELRFDCLAENRDRYSKNPHSGCGSEFARVFEASSSYRLVPHDCCATFRKNSALNLAVAMKISSDLLQGAGAEH